MAIKFPSGLGFRNDLKRLVGDKQNFFNEEERKKLQQIITEMEGLVLDDVVRDAGEKFLSQKVDLIVSTVFLERSWDPQKSAELIYEAHKVMESRWVPASLYRKIPNVLEEIGIKQCEPDLEIAIKAAFESEYGIGFQRLGYISEFRPKTAIDEANRKGKERF